MLVSVEGCIGVGKSTLLRLFQPYFRCHTLFEEAERNPFLEKYYQAQDRSLLAKHVQYTFLFLQEEAWREGILQVPAGALLLSDFHPMKSLIFARLLFNAEEQAHLSLLYHQFRIAPPDLVIYLKADVHTILSRLRRRADTFVADIDFTYLSRIAYAYEQFFNTYQGAVLTIDTSLLDYVERPTDVRIPLQKLHECFRMLSYVNPAHLLLTDEGHRLIHHTDETSRKEEESISDGAG